MAAERSPSRTPFPSDPEEFLSDERIQHFPKLNTFILQDEAGNDWQWLPKVNKWGPVIDEALIEQQSSVYKIPGVDENEPAGPTNKRKADKEEHATNDDNSNKKQKPEPEPKQNCAIFIENLPNDVEEDELFDEFSRAGMIAESHDTGRPRITMYADSDGNFKGEALIVYFRPESVNLAIMLSDGAHFRPGQAAKSGPMRITAADAKYKSQKTPFVPSDLAAKKGTAANRNREKIIQNTQKMNKRLGDWGDDGEDPQATPETSRRWDRIAVLKHMFTLEELSEDPDAKQEIAEDIEDECNKFGQVVSVTIYDEEADGVATVKFADARAAKACVETNDGRWFDKRRIVAYVASSRENFKMAKHADDEEDRLKRLTEGQDG